MGIYLGMDVPPSNLFSGKKVTVYGTKIARKALKKAELEVDKVDKYSMKNQQESDWVCLSRWLSSRWRWW